MSIMNKNETIVEDTGERMTPEIYNESLIYAEHITRYQSALALVKNKVVLDIASGSGYGTSLLADRAKYVFGVDISNVAINYARKKFSKKNTEFILGDGESIPLDENSVDIVISFETIEHIKDYKKFVKEIKRVLKPNGLVVISTPNDLSFIEGNHFHFHEFQENELTMMLKENFSEIKKYYQSTWKMSALGADSLFFETGKKDIIFENLSPLDKNDFLYFYFLCSNRKIEETIKPIAAAGELYSERRLQEKNMRYEERLSISSIEIEKLNNKLEETRGHLVGREEELSNIKQSKGYRLYNAVRRAKQHVVNTLRREK